MKTDIRKRVSQHFGDLCRYKDIQILKRLAASAHVHMYLNFPKNYSLAELVISKEKISLYLTAICLGINTI